MVRLPPNSRIDRFEIKSLIGTGGMGTLYLARDTSPNTYRLVALKLLNTTFESPDVRSRFAREARALASLNHPNVVNIYETGEFRGSPYIVMEYVSGETLAEKIKRRAPLTLTQKLKLMMELCAGLAHAHDTGIIHRDIKPANLMVDHHGRLRLLDFGIARVAESGATVAGVTMTHINMRIGTPGYMSPEQYEGGHVDRRSDIFAVGVVFHELLTYREVFPGATTGEIEARVLGSEPPQLSGQITGLDPEMASIVMRALKKRPADRFQDAAEMERALTKLWWRLGTAESAAPAAAPASMPAGGKKASRADVAYQRAMSAVQQGAPEAARRYALEAFADDPKHAGARHFLERQDPDFRPPPVAPPPPVRPPMPNDEPIEPTIVSTRSTYTRDVAPTTGEETIISTSGPRGGSPEKRRAAASSPRPSPKPSARSWLPLSRSYATAIGLILLVSVVVGAVLIAVLMRDGSGSVTPAGSLLTVKKPLNGTIVGRGIRCGTRGVDCATTLETDSMVELTLVPDDGFVADSYTDDCAPSGQFRMAAARTCGATFVRLTTPGPVTGGGGGVGERERHTLSVYPDPGGVVFFGDLRCSDPKGCHWPFPEGTTVDLTPQAERGYTFENFAGAPGTCDPEGHVLMDRPKSCNVRFVPERTFVAPPPIPTSQGGKPADKPKPVANPPTPAVVQAPPGGATTPPPTGEPPAPPPVPGGPPGTPPAPGSDLGPPPPPTGPSDEDLAKKEIADVLEQFRLAYEALSFDGVRRVYPTVNPRLRDQFKDLSSSKIAKAEPKFESLNTQEGTAVLEATWNRATVSKLSGKGQATLVLKVFFHKKNRENRWEIGNVLFSS